MERQNLIVFENKYLKFTGKKKKYQIMEILNKKKLKF